MRTYWLLGLLLGAMAVTGYTQENKHGIGFAGGYTGGAGISYKYFLNERDALQMSGLVYGDSELSFGYNVGVMYQRVLHQTQYTRLYLAPALSWWQRIDVNTENDIVAYSKYDSAGTDSLYSVYDKDDNKELHTGFLIGIEIKAFQLGLCFLGGYQVSFTESNTNHNQDYASRAAAEAASGIKNKFSMGFTGDVALHYYFN